MVFGSSDVSWNVEKIAFDPIKGSVIGSPIAITTGTRQFERPRPSPDGQWIVCASAIQQEDIYVARSDGSELHKLLDDVYKDRDAIWSPIGTQILFQSNRGQGIYHVWRINLDGSGLQQLTQLPRDLKNVSGVWNPRISPDGSRIAVNSEGACYIIDLSGTIPSNRFTTLPQWKDGRTYFESEDWSKDGKQLAGSFTGKHGDLPGVVTYSLESQRYLELTDFGQLPRWLKDSRQILFSSKGNLYLLDSQTKKWHSILSAPLGAAYQSATPTNDDRTIYFEDLHSGSDVWMLTFQ
jgi:Tol biopolymer transport system component